MSMVDEYREMMLCRRRPRHMRGWEIFGLVNDPLHRGPTSRPLGKVEGRKTVELGTEEFPAGETHGGVAHVQVQTHGDSPFTAFVYVNGPDRGAVEACFARTVTAVQSLLGEVWT